MYQQYPPQQPVYYGSQYSGCVKFLLYVLSFMMPVVGIIIGVIFMSRPDPESKGLGQTCLILGIVSIVLWCCAGLVGGLAPGLLIPLLESSGY